MLIPAETIKKPLDDKYFTSSTEIVDHTQTRVHKVKLKSKHRLPCPQKPSSNFCSMPGSYIIAVVRRQSTEQSFPYNCFRMSASQRGLTIPLVIDAAWLPSSSDHGELQTEQTFNVTDFIPTSPAITLFCANLGYSSDFKRHVTRGAGTTQFKVFKIRHCSPQENTWGQVGVENLERGQCSHTALKSLLSEKVSLSTDNKKSTVLVLWETFVEHWDSILQLRFQPQRGLCNCTLLENIFLVIVHLILFLFW